PRLHEHRQPRLVGRQHEAWGRHRLPRHRQAGARRRRALPEPRAPRRVPGRTQAPVRGCVMFGLFRRRKSKDELKERLKLVLSYDRAKLSPGSVEELKKELLTVIKKYFPAGETDYDVRVEQQGERMILIANLPVKGSAS